MLNFTFGSAAFRPLLCEVDGVVAAERDLLAAGGKMVQRMVRELWNYFGIPSYPNVTSNPLTLRLTSGTHAWDSAYARAFNQLGGGVRQLLSSGVTPSEIQRQQLVLQDRWHVARRRLIAFLNVDQTILLGTRSATVPHTAIVGAEQQEVWGQAKIVMNPFTWFYRNGTESMSYRSERSRAAYSPTLLLLHELSHMIDFGCLFLHHPTSGVCSGVLTDEQVTVEDIDAAIRVHIGIGLRVNYPRSAVAGRRLYVDNQVSRDPEPLYRQPRAGSQWVEFPSEDTLRTGNPP